MDIAIVGALTPFAFFVAAVLIVWIVLNNITNDKKHKYNLVAKALEMGQTIPENLFAPQEKPGKKSFDDFKNAIVFLTLALALWAVFIYQKGNGFGVDNGFGLMLVSAFFTALGTAFLIIGFLRRAEEKRENIEK